MMPKRIILRTPRLRLSVSLLADPLKIRPCQLGDFAAAGTGHTVPGRSPASRAIRRFAKVTPRGHRSTF